MERYTTMFCNWSWCEFYNVVLGGLLIGVITSFLVILLTKIIEHYNFKRKYRYLESPSGQNDWIAYSMSKEDGRVRDDNPNGSSMNISVKDGKIYLKLHQQNDDRIWKGVLTIQQEKLGVVSYKYNDKHEYGKREVVIGNFVENNETFDFLFLTPLNNMIYYIESRSDQTQIVHYNYGNEIFIRKRAQHGINKKNKFLRTKKSRISWIIIMCILFFILGIVLFRAFFL